MDTEFYFSKFSSGGNSVELMGKGEGYQVISNEAPVFSSESLPDSLSRYYREISNLNSAQESGKDMSLSLFADEVVKLNRIIIPKLAMLGKSQEVSYMKSLNSALEEAMDCFFQDTLEQKVKAIKLWKADPMTALASVPSVNGDESTNAGAGETVTPKKLELKEGKKIDYNTVELKAVNPHVTAPFPGEDEFKMPIEAPTKVKSTMQMKNHPEKQKPITGEEIEPVYIKRSRIEKDEAFELGRDLGVNFDKISLEEWMEGLKIEHEHTDAVGDDHNIIGKIAHEHLKENPKYYKLLEEYVEKSLVKAEGQYDMVFPDEEFPSNIKIKPLKQEKIEPVEWPPLNSNSTNAENLINKWSKYLPKEHLGAISKVSELPSYQMRVHTRGKKDDPAGGLYAPEIEELDLHEDVVNNPDYNNRAKHYFKYDYVGFPKDLNFKDIVALHEFAHSVETKLDLNNSFGHWINYEMDTTGKHDAVTKYAATGQEERFAESYLFFLFNPEYLKRKDPLAYKFMEMNVFKAKPDRWLKSIRKDFDKMEEGDQAHESINLERTTTKTGDTQKPINGGDDKLEKEAFSMDAPKVKNGEMQEPIMHKSTSNPSETNGHGEESSKRESDYVGESSNQNGPPRKIKLNIKTGEEEQTEGGGDVRENGKKYFDKSMDDDYEFDVEPVKWSHIEE